MPRGGAVPGLDVLDGTTMTGPAQRPKPIVSTTHARQHTQERGTREEDVREAIRIGQREPAQRRLFLYRLNLEFKHEGDGQYHAIQTDTHPETFGGIYEVEYGQSRTAAAHDRSPGGLRRQTHHS